MGLNARQRDALNAFKVDGYDDEFRIAGQGGLLSDDLVEPEVVDERIAFEVIPVKPISASGVVNGTVSALLVALAISVLSVFFYKRYISGGDFEKDDCNAQHRKKTRKPNKVNVSVATVAGKKEPCSAIERSSSRHLSLSCGPKPGDNPRSSQEAAPMQVEKEPNNGRPQSAPPALVNDSKDSSGDCHLQSTENPCELTFPPQQNIEQVKDEFRCHVLRNAAAFNEVLREAGIDADEKTLAAASLQAAIVKSQTVAMQEASFQAEVRGYKFLEHQHSIGRAIAEHHHKKVVATLREDNAWAQKLLLSRNACLDALKVASIRSYNVILGFQPFLAAFRMLNALDRNYGLGYHMMHRLTTCSPVYGTSSSLGSWLLTRSLPYFPAGVRDMIDVSSCFLSGVMAVSSLAVSVLSAVILARAFGLPLLSSSTAIALSLLSGLTRAGAILKQLVVLGSSTAAAACYVLLLVSSSRRGLLQKGVCPSSKDVTVALDPFNRFVDLVKGLPLLVVLYQVVESKRQYE